MDHQAKVTGRTAAFTGASNYSIAYRVWLPVDLPRAVMLIVPGFKSHSAYFDWAAERLAGLGLVSYGVDLRGRGLSDGERFYIDSFDDYVSDVDGLLKVAKSAHPGLPVYVLGHSAGGVVSCLFVQKHGEEISGLICESFAFQVPAPDFALAVIKGISRLAPHAHVLALKNKDFSRDPVVVARMDADALIANESQPAQTVAEMVRAGERLKREMPDFLTPVLILHGTADVVTKPQGSRYFFDHACSSDKTLKLYDGHVHDLLNDVDRERVMSDIVDWLDQRLAKT